MRSELYNFLWLCPYWHEPPSTKRTKEWKEKSHTNLLHFSVFKKSLDYRNVTISKTFFIFQSTEDCAESATSPENRSNRSTREGKRSGSSFSQESPLLLHSPPWAFHFSLLPTSLFLPLFHPYVLLPYTQPHTPSGPLPMAILPLFFCTFMLQPSARR